MNQRLLEACSIADFSRVSLCLDQGADPNAQDELGLSCLHKVCQNPDDSRPLAQIVDLLIKKGARVRHSALHCSATPQAVRALLAANADVNARTTDGKTALVAALSADREDVALELVRSNATFDGALLLKVKSVALAREFLTRGADPNVTDAFGNSPLQLAVDRGDRAFARVLLEFRADAAKVAPRVSTADQPQPQPPQQQPEVKPEPLAGASPPIRRPPSSVTPDTGRSTPSGEAEGKFSLAQFLGYLGAFEGKLGVEPLSNIELGAIEGALDVVLRKVRSLKK